MGKRWKNFGNYKISDSGDVVSIKTGKLMSQQLSSDGYPVVSLTGIGRTTYRVHRLVAYSFVDKVEGKYEINHKDGDKTNNHYTNLEWCNRSENMKHAWSTGLMSHSAEGRDQYI